MSDSDGALPVAAPMSETGALIQRAIETGNLDALERLEAMHERAAVRTARAEFNEALTAFHGACPLIAETSTAEVVSKKTGARFSYQYASLEQIVKTIRPVLATNGLSFSWDSEAANGYLTVKCCIRHIGGHSETSSFVVPVEKGGRMSDAQSAGSALTYAKRQSLTSALGLATCDPDDDGAGSGAPNDMEPITEEQAERLSLLAADLHEDDYRRFLGWMGAASLGDIPASQYARAEKGIRAKLAAAAKS